MQVLCSVVLCCMFAHSEDMQGVCVYYVPVQCMHIVSVFFHTAMSIVCAALPQATTLWHTGQMLPTPVSKRRRVCTVVATTAVSE